MQNIIEGVEEISKAIQQINAIETTSNITTVVVVLLSSLLLYL